MNKRVEPEEVHTKGDELTRVYRRRWLTLLLFCAYSLSNAYQWIHLNIVFDVILANYNASLPSEPSQANLAIDWLSMVYMLAYALLILPAAWVLDRYGLRVTSICATSLNFIGALMKCFATDSNRFWLLFAGQTVCATAQSFILGIPAPLAAAWFGINELSTATALGVFGTQIGVAVGFVLPPLFISKGDGMQQQLLWMFIGGACVTGALFLLVLLFFCDRPPLPPSLGQLTVRRNSHNQEGETKTTGKMYAASLRRLLTCPAFVLLTISYGLNTGVYYALSTLLNPIVVPEFKKIEINSTSVDAIEQQVGWAGFTLIAAGVLGAVIYGIVLDRTRAFKLTTLSCYSLSLIGTALFTATLPLAQLWLVFVSMAVLGFFMTGYLPVGFEYAAEITYPENEGLSSGILNASAQPSFGLI
uniref:MFS domain-containing protein n=1 Tax=Macrostomum lignano TaxID=282301 RepID=A0A1I8FVC7_9PLAT